MSRTDHSNSLSQGAIGRVAVLCGGHSPERQVSLKSGAMVFKALQEKGVDAVLVDVGTDLVEQLQSIAPDRVFLALHGGDGEDGTVQGLLDFMGIPYTGSGVKGSALAMDKYRSKLVWQGIGLPTPKFAMVEAGAEYDPDTLPVPCFVKPSDDGSSICTFPVFEREQLIPAINKVLEHAGQALVEQFVDGPEFTVAIVDGRPLPAIRLETDNAFYDYQAKYLSSDTRYLLPCGLSAEQEQELQALALKAFNSLGCSGWGRVDVMQDAEGAFWLLEVNTIPGMTDHSLVPMAARAEGYSFADLVMKLLMTAGQKERQWMPAGISVKTASVG